MDCWIYSVKVETTYRMQFWRKKKKKGKKRNIYDFQKVVKNLIIFYLSIGPIWRNVTIFRDTVIDK